MDEFVNNDTTCSSDENFSRVGSPCKVTTLRDLRRRRQVLLAQKMFLSNKKVLNNQNLPEVEAKTDFLMNDPKTAGAGYKSND